MEITEIFYPRERAEWRDWLVEEGLCFGWIRECGERRREEAQKRLNYLIKNTKKGKMYGTRPLEGIDL